MNAKPVSKKGPNRPKASPGPKPDVLKLKGKWHDAVKQSLKKREMQSRKRPAS